MVVHLQILNFILSTYQIREPIFGKKSGLEFSHLWNKAVDQAFGHVIESFSSRGK